MSLEAWDPLADLSAGQREKLDAYEAALVDVNRRINLVSAGSAGDVRRRHIVHSLSLAARDFPAGATVVDIGTGGGLPAIPLAIRFPGVRFVGIDAVGKKVEAVRLFARRLGLDNVEAWAGRVEDWPGRAEYAVSRATAPLADLWRWFSSFRATAPDPPAGHWIPGLVCLKGGDLAEEIHAMQAEHALRGLERIDLRKLLGDASFRDKEIIAAW